MTTYAHCYRSGEIVFTPRSDEPGLIALGSGGKGFEAKVRVRARHSRTDDTILVPGVPEAASDDDALIAAAFFRDVLGGMTYDEAAKLHDVEGVRERALQAAFT